MEENRKQSNGNPWKSPQQRWLEEELAAIDRNFEKTSQSREATVAFLQRAGILDENEELAEDLRPK